MKLTHEMLVQGQLLKWAESQACRLSQLNTFKPQGWTAIGYAKAYKGLMDQLRAVDWPDGVSRFLVSEIIDMARLKAIASQHSSKCKCGADGTPTHSCPYDEDVHNDPTPCCNCCAACCHECAMDI